MANKHKGTSYKQPRSINVVSISLILFLLGVVYSGYNFAPAYFKRYQVKQLVQEAASRFYKLSPLEKSLRVKETTKLMNEMRKRTTEVLGFDDPQMTVQLLINEETKKVNVVAEYDYTIHFVGTEKVRVLHFKVVGESDYMPVDW